MNGHKTKGNKVLFYLRQAKEEIPLPFFAVGAVDGEGYFCVGGASQF